MPGKSFSPALIERKLRVRCRGRAAGTLRPRAASLFLSVALASCGSPPRALNTADRDAVRRVVLAEVGVVPGAAEEVTRILHSDLPMARARARLAAARLGLSIPEELSGNDTAPPPGPGARTSKRARQEREQAAAEELEREEVLARAVGPALEDPGRAAGLLERLARERDERMRWALTWALARAGPGLPGVRQELVERAADPNFLTATFALSGLARHGVSSAGDRGVAVALERLLDPGAYWIVREAARRTLGAWAERSALPPGDAARVTSALAASPAAGRVLSPDILLPASLPTGLVAAERRASDPVLMESLLSRGLRSLRARVVIPARGELVLELFAVEAPLHVAAFVGAALEGQLDGGEVASVDPLLGVLLVEGDPHAAAVPPEPSSRRVRRGAIVSPGDRAPGLFIAHLPLPELDLSGATVWGRVALGMEVLDALRGGERLGQVQILDSYGRPLTRSGAGAFRKP